MENIKNELSRFLRESGELENGVFVEISLQYIVDAYVARKDYYTVKGGVVYALSDTSAPFATGDTLWDVKRDCHRIGDYDKTKSYQNKTCSFEYSDIVNLLNFQFSE